VKSESRHRDEMAKNPCPVCGSEMEDGALAVEGYFAGWMAEINWVGTSHDPAIAPPKERIGRSNPFKGFSIDGFQCRTCRLMLLRY